MYVWLPPDLYAQLLHLAAADYDTIAHLVRVAVARYVSSRAEHADGGGPVPMPQRPRDLERAQ